MNNYYNYEKKEGKPSKIAIAAIGILIVVVAFFTISATIKAAYEPPKENVTFVTNVPFSPFEDLIGGQFVGFDIDLAYKFGDKYDKIVIIRDVSEFDDIFQELDRGRADMAVSAITITSDNSSRNKLADFSIGYFNASQAVLAVKNGKFKIVNELFAKDFEGMKIGYQGFTTSQSWVEVNLVGRVALADNRSFGDIDSGLQILRDGGFDGIILDEPAARAFAKKYPDMVVAGVIDTKEVYGVAVKKGDPKKLLPKINELIREMKENGEYEELIAKHFGGEKK